MMKPVFICRPMFVFALIFGGLFFCGFQSGPQPPHDIVLKDEPIAITPKEFYIADVIDERENRTAVAWLLVTGSADKNQSRLVSVDLQGGGLIAIKQFIQHNLPRNPNLRPIIAGLKKCTVTESISGDGRVTGHISVVMSFSLEDKDEAPIDSPHLTDYSGSATYTRGLGRAQDIEPTLRHVIENGIIYFDTWMNRQVSTNIKLAKAVKVTFEDYTEKPEGDSIYYSVNRPLTWDDFQSKIPDSRFDAEMFATIGYDERNTVSDGIVNVRLLIKVCLPKSAGWAKEGSRNSYSLNHEQRHFDIAKIAAEGFKQKILKENLPPGNYDGLINVDYLDSYREMTDMQKLYDRETRHGSDAAAQERWNAYIDKELKKLGVK